jgi:hypothetical protein
MREALENLGLVACWVVSAGVGCFALLVQVGAAFIGLCFLISVVGSCIG